MEEIPLGDKVTRHLSGQNHPAATRANLIDENADAHEVAAIDRTFRFGIPGYLLALAVSFFSSISALVLLFMMAALYLMPPTWVGAAGPRHSHDDQ